jgi:uncharacterized protein YebE (UPF0316 family)
MDLSSSVPTTLQLALLIFLAEMCVVSLSTVRIIFVARGRKYLAPLLGMFEIIIWLYAIGQIMRNLTDVSCYVAFAGGFAAGNFFGILIEQRLAIGSLVVRIITNKDARLLIADLKAARYGVTSMEGRGSTGPVRIVFSVIQRKELANMVAIIHGFDPKAFYSVEDLQSVAEGIFPDTRALPLRWPRLRKTKGIRWVVTDGLPEGEVIAQG